MVQLSADYVLKDFETSQTTIREALDTEEQSWYDLIDQKEFRIPEYQRNYSWESTNRQDFYSTLRDVFTELQPIPNNLDDITDFVGIYMGAVYVAEPGEDSEHEELDIVDGQQRLATFQLLLKTLYDYTNSLESEADDQNKIELKAELSDIKTKLDAAFSGTDPSVIMNSEDEGFFKALAAYPDSWQIKVRDILKEKIEENKGHDLSGQNRPRVKTVEELIDMIQDPIQTNGDSDLKEFEPFTDESDGEDEDDDGDDEGSLLEEFIRFETSHERMFKSYQESYDLIEELFDDLTNQELEERANVLMNFTSFILYGVVVNRCLITEPNPDLRLDIFQSINDKGRPLHNVDKIRARIKHRLIGEDDSGPMDEWRETLARHGGDKDDIEDMLVYFVAATDDSISDISGARNELMNVFNRSTSNDSNVQARLTSDNATELVTNVSQYSKYYKDIKDCEFNHFSRSINDSDRQEIKRILDRVGNKLSAKQWLAVGPWVYLKTDTDAPGHWDEEDVGDFLYSVFDAIEVVTLRQSISERSGEAIEGVYVDTVQNFTDRDSDEQFDSSQFVSDLAGAVRDSSGDLFEDGLIDHFAKNRSWTTSATGQCVLQRTTSRYLSENDIGLSVQDYSEIEIEHILPQTPISERDNRTSSDEDLGRYAWLKYFFRTQEDGENALITDAAQVLIDEEIPSLSKSDIEPENLSEDYDQDKIEQIQKEIKNRFIDDIGNLLLLVDKDNIENSNDLMSKKLPVYAKDDYLQVVVNEYFNNGNASDFASSEYVSMEERDFEELENDNPEWDSDAAIRVDKSWNFEVMFDRKSTLIYEILQHLAFDLEPEDDEDSSVPTKNEFEGLLEQVEDAVADDRERRIGRRAF